MKASNTVEVQIAKKKALEKGQENVASALDQLETSSAVVAKATAIIKRRIEELDELLSEFEARLRDAEAEHERTDPGDEGAVHARHDRAPDAPPRGRGEAPQGAGDARLANAPRSGPVLRADAGPGGSPSRLECVLPGIEAVPTREVTGDPLVHRAPDGRLRTQATHPRVRRVTGRSAPC